jgi:hypothetical protein
MNSSKNKYTMDIDTINLYLSNGICPPCFIYTPETANNNIELTGKVIDENIKIYDNHIKETNNNGKEISDTLELPKCDNKQ